MNRQEAKLHINVSQEWLEDEEIIDQIYDDFEAKEKELHERINELELASMDNKTCGSCKWNNGCQVVIACEDWNLPYKEANLKCDKWESKDD